MRLDQKLVDLKLAPTKSQALHLIRDGLVLVNGEKCLKPGRKVNQSTVIELLEQHKYVSRGAKKILAAIKQFNPRIANQVCVDFGASTGGFTQVMLENGASKVYAIDVGTDQLHPKIKSNPRVIELSGQNIKDLQELPEKPTFATVDLSFISITKVWQTIQNLMGLKSQLIVLYKPQFEVGQVNLNKSGIANPETAKEFLDLWLLELEKAGLKTVAYIPCPVLGQDGNQEYLVFVEI
jgi:23S rRNA (cytidine1920-2'-O)/16S rRNA (cytidine1409-2'-O)-methyltransferase